MLFAFLVLVTIIGLLFYSAYGDWKQIYENRKAIRNLTYEYNELLNQERTLEAEVIKFNDPTYLARFAREKFLYSLPDELIIRIPNR